MDDFWDFVVFLTEEAWFESEVCIEASLDPFLPEEYGPDTFSGCTSGSACLLCINSLRPWRKSESGSVTDVAIFCRIFSADEIKDFDASPMVSAKAEKPKETVENAVCIESFCKVPKMNAKALLLLVSLAS